MAIAVRPISGHISSTMMWLFFAGDERQTVNPSGFRWEGVRARFYESGSKVPDLSRLSINFRSSGAIVELGNALLDLKRAFVGAGKFESPETWKFSGKAPVVIEGIQETTILDIVRQSGADRIILTRSTEEKLRLKTLLGTELIFTIFEAKGLEFDTVLLWKFIEDRETERLWEAMGKGSDGASEDMIPHLRHELNLLYVAVARAKSILAIYDSSAMARRLGRPCATKKSATWKKPKTCMPCSATKLPRSGSRCLRWKKQAIGRKPGNYG